MIMTPDIPSEWEFVSSEDSTFHFKRGNEGLSLPKREVVSFLETELRTQQEKYVQMVEGMSLKNKEEYTERFPKEWLDCCGDGEMSGFNIALQEISKKIKES